MINYRIFLLLKKIFLLLNFTPPYKFEIHDRGPFLVIFYIWYPNIIKIFCIMSNVLKPTTQTEFPISCVMLRTMKETSSPLSINQIES